MERGRIGWMEWGGLVLDKDPFRAYEIERYR